MDYSAIYKTFIADKESTLTEFRSNRATKESEIATTEAEICLIKKCIEKGMDGAYTHNLKVAGDRLQSLKNTLNTLIINAKRTQDEIEILQELIKNDGN